jgi:hypothetical protein
MERETDPRAILMLSKGERRIERSGDEVDRRSGWMVFAVNREQFSDSKVVTVRGIAILLPQQELYGEVRGSTIDFRDGWWVFVPRI